MASSLRSMRDVRRLDFGVDPERDVMKDANASFNVTGDGMYRLV